MTHDATKTAVHDNGVPAARDHDLSEARGDNRPAGRGHDVPEAQGNDPQAGDNHADRASEITLGIYEKALRWNGDWDLFFAQARDAGFSFVDLSVDESPERQARLDWSWNKCQEVRAAAHNNEIMIGGICLSVHRKVAPGSADPNVRAKALDIYYKGIDLCYNLGVPILQVAGYFAYYEDADPDARGRYIDTLRAALPYATRRGVTLAIENVDGNDISAIDDAMAVLEEIPSPYLQIYPDLGNIAEHGGNETKELQAGENRMMAIHIKDVLPGQPRRIPIGEGVANFPRAFAELKRQGFCGRMMIEMWNDEAEDSAEISRRARIQVEELITSAGITITDMSRPHACYTLTHTNANDVGTDNCATKAANSTEKDCTSTEKDCTTKAGAVYDTTEKKG